MDKLLKPSKLAIDPNSSSSAKEWKHWISTFNSYVSRFVGSESSEQVDGDKLAALVNCASAEVYEHFDQCTSFTEAEATLEKLFVKQPNEVFARHLLRVAKQKPQQSLADFKCTLTKLAKDCKFKDVTAAQYRDDMLRDSFINGLLSSDIRQRLLEHKTLCLNEAYEQAVTLDNARKDNIVFSSHTSGSVDSSFNCLNNSDPASEALAPVELASSSFKSKGVCRSCGRDRPHDFKNCKARMLNCFKCGERGHFSRACRSQKKVSTFPRSLKNDGVNSAVVDQTNYSLCGLGSNSPSVALSDEKVLCVSTINNKHYKTLLDTGSSRCFVHKAVAHNFVVRKVPVGFIVGMAQVSSKVEVAEMCRVNIQVLGSCYKGLDLYVMDDLCSEIVLGRDFFAVHKKVTFVFNGSREELVIPSLSQCSVLAANVRTPSLFANLKEGWEPIATKSRRYNKLDWDYMFKTVSKWKESGTVKPSNSPWRAQCVVVKSGNKIERLAVDYSQTINLFTERDAYPIPLIEDIVNTLAAYKFYASYDLKKAYHQIPIPKKDQPFTAFEACGELLEFTVIPFGVTNGGPVFQRIMTEIVKEDKLNDTFVYFDNVVIGADSMESLQGKASKFKNAMKRRRMTLNESKTVYGVTELPMLGYCVGNGVIKPDPERLRPLLELPPPVTSKALKRVMGLFAYYAKWVVNFSDKISRLKSVTKFPLSKIELDDFESLKKCIAAAALQAIDETLPFTVECDASDVAVSATLNQNDRPVAFMSRSLSGSELAYPAIEKEATAIIESVRKWEHLLMRQHFFLVTDQRSVAFMLNTRHSSKIKNNKIMCWRLELASFSYTIRYRPGKFNVGPDTLTRASCSAVSAPRLKLEDLHKELCCPGVTRLWHYVRTKNLPYSLEDVKWCCSNCDTCAEVRPQFFAQSHQQLVKAMQPMERLNIDFKGPLPTASRNLFFLCVIDEYSRYPFVFPCADTSATTVIGCLEKLFSLFGTCNFVHSDRGSAFSSKQLKDYLLRKGIASSHTTPYHPQGNSQCERYNGIVWKAVRSALKTRNLSVKKWEKVLPVALDSIRTLLCTSTGESPHSRFFGFTRRSHHGSSLPDWLSKPGPVFLRKFVRRGKNDDVVQKVELLHANPMYARVKFPDGKESNVSLRDIARCPQNGRLVDDGERFVDGGERLVDDSERLVDDGGRLVDDGERLVDDGERLVEDGERIVEDGEKRPEEGDIPDQSLRPMHYRDEEPGTSGGYRNSNEVAGGGGNRNEFTNGSSGPRRSARKNKGVPPPRFGYPENRT